MISANAAAEIGPAIFDWWPDWRRMDAAIIASGPSTKQANIPALQSRVKVIAIKENVDLCPWADVVYGCDAPWWRNRNGLKDFGGLKISYASELTARFQEIKIIDVRKYHDDIVMDAPGVVGSGGNSGFQALNLAVQFGVRRILLIGFDMHDRSGVHWYGRANGPGRNNPSESNFRRWRGAFANASTSLSEAGIEVVNASPSSMLTCFKQASIEQALAAWA